MACGSVSISSFVQRSYICLDRVLTGFNEISYVQFFYASLKIRDRMSTELFSTNWVNPSMGIGCA